MRLVCVCTWHLQRCPSVSVSPRSPVSISQREETGQELTAPINKLCVPGGRQRLRAKVRHQD